MSKKANCSSNPNAPNVLNDIGLLYDEAAADHIIISNMEKTHGKIVDRRVEPFHDVTVYEDGYEERFYIGD